nr:MAG: polyprotein [Longquan bat picorna-like virus 5]
MAHSRHDLSSQFGSELNQEFPDTQSTIQGAMAERATPIVAMKNPTFLSTMASSKLNQVDALHQEDMSNENSTSVELNPDYVSSDISATILDPSPLKTLVASKARASATVVSASTDGAVTQMDKDIAIADELMPAAILFVREHRSTAQFKAQFSALISLGLPVLRYWRDNHFMPLLRMLGVQIVPTQVLDGDTSKMRAPYAKEAHEQLTQLRSYRWAYNRVEELCRRLFHEHTVARVRTFHAEMRTPRHRNVFTSLWHPPTPVKEPPFASKPVASSFHLWEFKAWVMYQVWHLRQNITQEFEVVGNLSASLLFQAGPKTFSTRMRMQLLHSAHISRVRRTVNDIEGADGSVPGGTVLSINGEEIDEEWMDYYSVLLRKNAPVAAALRRHLSGDREGLALTMRNLQKILPKPKIVDEEAAALFRERRREQLYAQKCLAYLAANPSSDHNHTAVRQPLPNGTPSFAPIIHDHPHVRLRGLRKSIYAPVQPTATGHIQGAVIWNRAKSSVKMNGLYLPQLTVPEIQWPKISYEGRKKSKVAPDDVLEAESVSAESNVDSTSGEKISVSSMDDTIQTLHTDFSVEALKSGRRFLGLDDDNQPIIDRDKAKAAFDEEVERQMRDHINAGDFGGSAWATFQSAPWADLATAISDMSDDMYTENYAGLKAAEYVSRLVQLMSFCFVFAKTKGIVRASAVLAYVTSFPREVTEIVLKLIAAYRVKYEATGAENETDLKEVCRSTLELGISNVFGGVSGIGEFLSSSFLVFSREIRRALAGITAKAIAQFVFDSIREFITRIKNAVALKSFDPLFGPMHDPFRLVATAELLMANMSSLTYTGMAPSQRAADPLWSNPNLPAELHMPVVMPVFSRVCNQHLALMRERISSISSGPTSQALGSATSKFSQFTGALGATISASGQRRTPFGVLINGLPQIGKSTFNQDIVKCLLRSQDLCCDNTVIGIYEENMNFQPTIHTATSAILIDDPGLSTGSLSANQENFASFTMRAINCNAFQIEQPDVSMKGKVNCAPEMVLMTSNSTTFNLEGRLKDVEPFYARFPVRLHVRLKDAYNTGNTEHPILNKELAHSVHITDIHDIDLFEYDPTSPDHYRFVSTLSNSEVLVELISRFTRHREIGRRRMEHVPTSSVCRQCYQDITSRACAHVQAPAFEGVAENWARWVRLKIRVHRVKLRFLAWWYSLGPEREVLEATMSSTLTLCSAVIVPIVIACSVAYMYSKKTFAHEGRADNGNGEDHSKWVRAPIERKPAFPYYSPKLPRAEGDCREVAAQSMVKVKGTYEGPAVHIHEDAVLVPDHYLREADRSLMSFVRVESGSRSWRVQVNSYTYRVLSDAPEAGILKVAGLGFPPTDVLEFFMDYVPKDLKKFDDVVIFGVPNGNSTMNKRQMEGTWSCDAITAPGDCGNLYYTNNGPLHANFLGIHFGKVDGLATCALVNGSTVRMVLRQLAVSPEGLSPHATLTNFSRGGLSRPVIHGVGVLSEVAVALTEARMESRLEPVVYGTSTCYFGATFSTKCSKSAIYDELGDLETEVCGTDGYWHLPDMRGKKQGPAGWESCYTVAFRTSNRAMPDERLMWMAVMDYLKGVSRLYRDGFRELSVSEAVLGLPGTIVGSVNMATSMGPPFFGSKSHHIDRSSEEVYVSTALSTMLSDYDFSKQRIPATVAVCIPKDEVLKKEYTRIFCVMPAAFNLEAKRVMAPIKAMLRAYPAFFECAVGIDMTSREAIEFQRIIDRCGGDLWDTDAKALDKSWSSSIYSAVANVFYALGVASVGDGSSAFKVVKSLQHCLYYIKGDWFSMPWNPSGNDVTVELNCVCMSICERYAFFRTHPELQYPSADVEAFREQFYSNPLPPGESTFRNCVSMMAYGDDVVKRTSHLKVEGYFQVWRDELGITLTDSSKSDVPRPTTWERCVFLKRNFRDNEDIGRVVTPLDLRSIVRMLRYRRPGSLTLGEHLEAVLDAASRELIYHGEVVYDKFRNLLVPLAISKGCSRAQDLFPAYAVRLVEARRQDFRSYTVF